MSSARTLTPYGMTDTSFQNGHARAGRGGRYLNGHAPHTHSRINLIYTSSRIYRFHARTRIRRLVDVRPRSKPAYGGRYGPKGAPGCRLDATVSKLEAGEPATRMEVFFDALTALGLELAVARRGSKADFGDLF